MTLGHVDIVTRASRLFDRVWVAVAHNPAKTPLFSAAERVALAQRCLSHLGNVTVEAFDGLSATFAREHQATALIRGLRSLADVPSEFAMAQMNRALAPQLETMFLMADPAYQHASSSLLKEVASLGADVAALAPPPVIEALSARYRDLRRNG